MSQGNRDAPAAGPDIDDVARRAGLVRMPQRFFHDELGLRTWNEHVGSDLEVETPEFPMTRDVGDGLPRRTAGDQGLETLVE